MDDELTLDIELSEIVWRIEIQNFPEDGELWGKFIELMERSNVTLIGNEIDHEGPSERFYLDTAGDCSESEVRDAVNQCIQELGIGRELQ